MSNLLAKIFKWGNQNLEGIEPRNQKEASDIKDTNFNNHGFIPISPFGDEYGLQSLQRLERLECRLSGLKVTKDVSDYIDESVVNNPIISQAHSVFLNTADTEFELELETTNKKQQSTFQAEIEKEFGLLFPGCYSVRDVSKLLMDRALSYGLIAYQFQPGTESREAGFVLPPVWSLEWRLIADRWALLQNIAGVQQVIDTERDKVVYKPLLPLKATAESRWFVPPFKPALKAAIEYEVLRASEVQIAKRTGMQTVFDVAYKVLGLPDWISKNGGEKESQKSITSRISAMTKGMMGYLQNGFIIRTDEYDVKPLQTVEPSANIQTFDQLMAQRVIAGCKAYAPMIGYSGKENQTTLSSVQMRLVYNFVTTLQEAADHALKLAIFYYGTDKGYAIKAIKIKRSKPVLDSLLDYAKAQEVLQAVEIKAAAFEQSQNEPNANQSAKEVKTGGNEDANNVDS